MTKEKQSEGEGTPPIFKSWNQMYAFVLVLHALIICLFYFITKTYS
ncbi:MAG: hypothetical protein AAGD05_04215 [Bacteroidota bacterium]